MNDSHLFTLIFTGTWCLVGAVFLCVGIGLRRSFLKKEERQRARASGTVEEIVRRRSGDSSSFYPIVSFDYDGRKVSLESNSGGGRKKYYEGQNVEVLYDPEDPTCFRIEGDDTARVLGTVFTAIGLGCIAIGAIAAVLVNL